MSTTTEFGAWTTLLFSAIVVLIPGVVVIGGLRVADRIARRRDTRFARQIELTDAIHRELGAIVAPVVSRRRGGWLISMTVPVDQPGAIPTILRIIDERFGVSPRSGRAPYEVMLTRAVAGARTGAKAAERLVPPSPSRLAA